MNRIFYAESLALSVYPTRVGMNRNTPVSLHIAGRIPHASGDEPSTRRGPLRRLRVYPTRVGMNRLYDNTRYIASCIPHASGDEPSCMLVLTERKTSIPHASGDEPGYLYKLEMSKDVYPTRVGMNRGSSELYLLHAAYTPREWV